MRKEIRVADKEKGIVQVTIADERWYLKELPDGKQVAVPSVTWIAGKYPKGTEFYKWLASKGWDEAESIKKAAGDKGSKVHKAIEDVIAGNEVRIDSKYFNRSTDRDEELTLEECEAILSFVKWFNEVKPEVIATERNVFSDKYNYAGTIDFICKIGNEYWIVDFKTSKYIWAEYELQLSAYRQAVLDGFLDVPRLAGVTEYKMGILQVGYNKNKAGFKWNEIPDKFPLFLAARQIWANEHEGDQPSKRDYPVILSPKR